MRAKQTRHTPHDAPLVGSLRARGPRAARLRGLFAANVGTLVVVALMLFLPGDSAPPSDLAAAERASEPAPVSLQELEPSPQAPTSPPAKAAATFAAPEPEAGLRATPPATPPATQPKTQAHALDARLSARIRERVDAAVERARVDSRGAADRSNISVAVHVREAGVAGELVALRAEQALLPASNMKLVTSAAALVLLGPEWSFSTRFEADGPIEAGVLMGDLIVRAGADPLYDPTADGDVSALLAPLVAELRGAGLRRIAGDLVLDEGSYLAPEIGPSWPSAAQHGLEYCARSAGFTVNAGCLTAVVEAAGVGARARVRVEPRAHGLDARGEVITRAARTQLAIAVEARPPTVTVRGELPLDVPRWTTRFAHPDPVELYGHVLRDALRAGGITLDGAVVRTRGRAPARAVAFLRSPLLPQLRPINADSNNSVADQVFLALGAEIAGAGDRAGGARAVRVALERLGVSSAGLVQVDGSGLSRDNRVAARQITALLEAVLRQVGPRESAFIDSLAVAGERGTLDGRMRDGPARGRVYAKTGWISGASALSGVAVTTSGRQLAFSILIGYPRVSGLNNSCWKPLQDAICEELVQWRSP